jgi:ubiquinone/menaquinone biosynthesis C-methylase UbiE
MEPTLSAGMAFPMKRYYDRRAPEYDDWYLGTGAYADRPRPGWERELVALQGLLAELPPARTVDVACGTGFLSRHLHGPRTLLDQSERMLEIAAARCPGAEVVRADVPPLPFPGGAFERLFTGHFYGHLVEDERAAFLAEAARVAAELVVVDSARREGEPDEAWVERVLRDGSRHRVYKRRFDGAALAAELGEAEVLLDGDWFVAARAVAARRGRG